MSSADTPINWKQNLTVTWLGCFLTGAAFSLVMPFLPLYVEQLRVPGHSALNMWSGLVFEVSPSSSPPLPHRSGAVLLTAKDEKLLLLRSALGMSVVMMLMGMAQNIWQFLLLRALLGLLGGYSQRQRPDCTHPDPAPQKRLGAGHAVNRRGERRHRRPAGGWLPWPTTGACAPSSL